MGRKISLVGLVPVLLLLACGEARATRLNFEAGDGLLRAKSAKITAGSPFFFKTTAFYTRMDYPLGPKTTDGKKTGNQVWTYEGVAIPIKGRAEVRMTLRAE